MLEQKNITLENQDITDENLSEDVICKGNVKNLVNSLTSAFADIVELASETVKSEIQKLEEDCAKIEPEKSRKLDVLKEHLDVIEASKVALLKHLIKTYEIVYTTPKYIAGHSWFSCSCIGGVKPSICDFVSETSGLDRSVLSAKRRTKSSFRRAYEDAESYFAEIGDSSYITKVGKNFRDQMELREQQLLHELVLIVKEIDISDEISRIKGLMQPDKMTDELDGALKKIARNIVSDFPSFSELYGSIKYEKYDFNSELSFFERFLERNNLADEVEVLADVAWSKLNDALIDGLELFIEKGSYEIECLLRRKCIVPIELILEEIEESIFGIA